MKPVVAAAIVVVEVAAAVVVVAVAVLALQEPVVGLVDLGQQQNKLPQKSVKPGLKLGSVIIFFVSYIHNLLTLVLPFL